MNLPDKCPFCGAAIAVGDDGKKRVADLCVIFDCGSGFHELMDPIRTRSRACKATTRVEELEARCKRLESAARDLYLDCIASGARWTKAQTKHMHALRDVLEEKPCGGEPCEHCFRAECECCDADVASDMGDR